MRRILVWICVAAAGTPAFAQGTVYFSNHRVDVDAPVSYSDPGAGVNFPLGGGYLVQLYAGAAPDSLTPVSSAVPFMDSNGRGTGYFNGGPVTVSFLQPGTGGYFQIRFWDAAAGTTYEAGQASGSFGYSNTILLATLGDPNAAPAGFPADLVGLQPSAIVIIPEPSSPVLGLLGAVLLGVLGRISSPRR